MRAIFSVLGLMAVVLVIGLAAKKQLTAVSAPPLSAPPPAGSATAPAAAPQPQVQQFKHNLDAAMQQARPMPDDK